VIGVPLRDWLTLLLGLPVLTALVGLLLPAAARWILGLSRGLPLRPLLRLFGSLDQPWEIAVNVALWLAVGVAVGLGRLGSATVRLTGDELRVDHDGGSRTLARAEVAAVFVDGGRLVVLDQASRQVVRAAHRAPAGVLGEAFRAHGYPWRDADPYAGLYRPWVADAPELPPAVNAVLAARGTALEKKAGQEADVLRDAVEELGFAVRDDGPRQYWRPLVRS
jgi:hypothetical protein